MSPSNPLAACACVVAALATSAILSRMVGAPDFKGRFSSLDGLRGYLAYFVFLHHSRIWYGYARSREWSPPDSPLFVNLGEDSVALFFMITAFLFFSRLLESSRKEMAWDDLFISRAARLVPLYLFAIALLILTVAYLSHWTIHEPISRLAKSAVRWLGFSILGRPDLNGVEGTSVIVAGVTWSLPYEWFFYFCLPILGLAVRVRTNLGYLSIGILSMVAFIGWRPELRHLMAFGGGIIAAMVARVEVARRLSATITGSLAALTLLLLAYLFVPPRLEALSWALLTAAFILIACGADIFGALTMSAARMLGQISYSVYLLHGVFLFVTFQIIVGISRTSELSPLAHWLVALAVTPALIASCYLTYALIELPGIRLGSKHRARHLKRAAPVMNGEARVRALGP